MSVSSGSTPHQKELSIARPESELPSIPGIADEDDTSPSAFKSVVRIYCTHNEPDFSTPWQKHRQYASTSSGFAIEVPDIGRCIMTNAHSVEYATIIQVRSRGSATKVEAVVEAYGPDCDLSVLKVEDESFWEDLEPMQFGTLPEMQEEVVVLGYPIGGDSMSITSGVVSRVELQEYSQAGASLLAVQIDAAINPGNSGGPVVNGHFEVVGVAFQSLDGDDVENIGYVVPVNVILHFLEDIRRHGRYTGFCDIGVGLQPLESKIMRQSLGMDVAQSGVLITRTEPTARAAELIEKGDVIMALDGIKVANDGTIPFRSNTERVKLRFYVSTRFIEDTIRVTLLRRKQVIEVDAPLTILQRLIPSAPPLDDTSPPYLMVAGFVFTIASIPYIQGNVDEQNCWQSDEMTHLLNLASSGHLETTDQQVVVLARVLAHRVNLGFEHLENEALKYYNGQEVRSLAHLTRMLGQSKADSKDPFLDFEFANSGQRIIINQDEAEEATKDICSENSINSPMTPQLWESFNDAFNEKENLKE